LVLKEGEPEVSDPDVMSVYKAVSFVWNLYKEKFNRNSLDDEGMSLIQTIHFGEKYNNAFWEGSEMVYGDGDGEIFGKFFNAIDVIGHELSHGVVSFEADLIYENQSGALNESYADVFGIMVKQYFLNQTAEESDWLIGKGVLIGDYALRSMKMPGTAYLNHPILGDDPQPPDMEHYADLSFFMDNGGVHINSGIPNRAFYLAATKLGGYSWEKAGKIWYTVLCNDLSNEADFDEMGSCTVDAAKFLFGNKSHEYKAIKEAWKEVGVL
jgi:Zn-dependent metalloprotease